MKNTLAVFENFKIRRIYDEKSETWFFSVVDIIQVLIQQPDYQTARKYWNKLKERLIDLLSTKENDKSPDAIGNAGWRFIIGKEKVNKT